MKVLIACEFSGVVREAFASRGHLAVSCDFLPSETKGHHFTLDVRDVLLKETWDLMIAHPPCTYIANSGVSWLYRDKERWAKMFEGSMLFKELLGADIPRIAVENPIPHKHAMAIIEQEYTQIIQPYMFGHPERKATCLWLKNLPELRPTNDVKEKMLSLPKKEAQRTHYMSPSKDRGKERSRTFQGIADAMAEQWGKSDFGGTSHD